MQEFSGRRDGSVGKNQSALASTAGVARLLHAVEARVKNTFLVVGMTLWEKKSNEFNSRGSEASPCCRSHLQLVSVREISCLRDDSVEKNQSAFASTAGTARRPHAVEASVKKTKVLWPLQQG